MSTKNCIACAEEIKEEASLCRHCGVMQDDRRFGIDKNSSRLRSFDGTTLMGLSKQKLVLAAVGIVLLVGGGIAAIQFFTGHFEVKCTSIQVENPDAKGKLFDMPGIPRYLTQDQCSQVWVPGPETNQEVTGVDAD